MRERRIGDMLAATLLAKGILALFEIVWPLVLVPIAFVLNRVTRNVLPLQSPAFGPMQINFLLFGLSSIWFAALVYSWTHEPPAASPMGKEDNE